MQIHTLLNGTLVVLILCKHLANTIATDLKLQKEAAFFSGTCSTNTQTDEHACINPIKCVTLIFCQFIPEP